VFITAIDESKIFTEMSSSLRRDVSVYLVTERMGDVKIFQSLSPRLWPKLFPILNPTQFELHETVCTQGEECTEMLIILEGALLGVTIVDALDVKAAAAESGLTSLNATGQELASTSRLSGSAYSGGAQSNNEQRKERNIGSGDSINILCVLKVWDRCVESVGAITPLVEAYAVNADAFFQLFNQSSSTIDELSFDDIVVQEVICKTNKSHTKKKKKKLHTNLACFFLSWGLQLLCKCVCVFFLFVCFSTFGA
jgi:hypothetical protein